MTSVTNVASGHQRAEEWSLVYHRAVAELLVGSPEPVLSRARRNLARLAARHHGGARRYLDRWNVLVNGPREDLIAALTGEGEAERDLRQCSPFAGVLTPAERWRLFRLWREERGRTRATR